MSSMSLMAETTKPVDSKGHKPHTRLQQKCLDLQKKLPPLTDAQLRWGRKQWRPTGFYVKRGRGGRDSFFWCEECGQMDRADQSSLSVAVLREHTCSRCGKKLDIKPWYSDNKHIETNRQFCTITTCDDMQVVRVFNIHRYNQWGWDTIEHVQEVYTVWFDPKTGKETIVSRPYTRFYNHFRWRTLEPMKIARHNGGCSGQYVYDDLYDLDGQYIYPRTKVLPVLKRNGWTDKMTRMKASPIVLWRRLLTDPATETLAKTGQLRVLDHALIRGDRMADSTQWLPEVKVCNRHKYIIQDASMWFDLLDSLRELGLDTHSPKYICPDDLMAMHDAMQRRIDNKHIRDEIAKLNSQAKDWEGYYREKKGRYLGITFNDGNIFVHVIQSVAEMCEEGTRMHHCVYRMGYYKRPESLILSARDRGGNRLETVEVNLNTFSVVQSRGLQNHPTLAHADIIRLVEQNMNLIKRAKSNKIKAVSANAYASL